MTLRRWHAEVIEASLKGIRYEDQARGGHGEPPSADQWFALVCIARQQKLERG